MVQNVTFEVNAGEIVTLMGRNGAGKTTTLRALMGLVAKRSGSVLLDGQELLGQPAHTRFHAGLACSKWSASSSTPSDVCSKPPSSYRELRIARIGPGDGRGIRALASSPQSSSLVFSWFASNRTRATTEASRMSAQRAHDT